MLVVEWQTEEKKKEANQDSPIFSCVFLLVQTSVF